MLNVVAAGWVYIDKVCVCVCVCMWVSEFLIACVCNREKRNFNVWCVFKCAVGMCTISLGWIADSCVITWCIRHFSLNYFVSMKNLCEVFCICVGGEAFVCVRVCLCVWTISESINRSCAQWILFVLPWLVYDILWMSTTFFECLRHSLPGMMPVQPGMKNALTCNHDYMSASIFSCLACLYAWSLSTHSLYHMLYQRTKFYIRQINLNLSLAQQSEYLCWRIAALSPSSLREQQRR
jgi:hypothetical protein